MRENFPHKKAGDFISAGHLNKLSAVARRMARAGVGNNIVARHGESSFSQSGPTPWRQITFIVTNTQIDVVDDDDSGLYLGKTRWYDPTSGVEEWKTDDDGTEWELDASDQDLTLAVGDKLAVWWDRQRGMYVPAGVPGATTRHAFIDMNGTATGVNDPVGVHETAVETNEIRFALIGTFNRPLFPEDGIINNRTVTLNSHRLVSDDSTEEDISGVGFYSFPVEGVDDPDAFSMIVHVDVQTDIKDVPVRVIQAGLRMEAKSRGESIVATAGDRFDTAATVVDGWDSEVEANNEGSPRFEIQGDDIHIFVPPGEVWVIEAELMMSFDVGVVSSESSSGGSSASSSSTSSQSTSSISTSSSSISTSSSSQSTSSASSSTSSTSSSGTITHTRLVADVCCEDDEVVVVFIDLLHDSSGHFLGTTNRDPPDACLGD